MSHALTLAGALGRPIKTIEDAVLARAMFRYPKKDAATARFWAEDDIDQMSNSEFLAALAMGFDDLAKERKA
jgi:bifunctional DNase/RNase